MISDLPVHPVSACLRFCLSCLFIIYVFPLDLPVHPVSFLPLAGGVAGDTVRPGHRHVEPGLYPGGDAYGRATVCGLQ